MQFRLHYRGSLKTSKKKRKEAIQALRREFHCQLAELWGLEPLAGHKAFWAYHREAGITDIREVVGPFTFVPVITTKIYLLASLEILLLRPAPPGALIGHGGDLDNRMKTLLDALRIPSVDEIPNGDQPGDGESPFFCLLQDDALVTGLSVTTDRLLVPGAKPSEVLLVINVRVGASQSVYDNLGIIGTSSG